MYGGWTHSIAVALETTSNTMGFVSNSLNASRLGLSRARVPPQRLVENRPVIEKICKTAIASNVAYAVLEAMCKLARHSAEPLCGFEGERPSSCCRARSRSF